MRNDLKNRWLLPDGVEETLPPDALAVENLRRKILQTYHTWGYDLIMPAMIEYMDSLLTGTAHSLDLITFALVDQLTGKQMGVRSDMTPQAARIDAHLLADSNRNQRISRLCYCGHLLHAQGEGITSRRTPLQIGAEIFGNDSIGADVEVVSLMIATLHTSGLDKVAIDIGHVGIFRSLISNSGLDQDQENRLFDMLQRKSIPELKNYLAELSLSDSQREHICRLALLNGDLSIIDEARQLYSGYSDELSKSLDHIEAVVVDVQKRYPDTLIHCDLAELRGYSYHTGLVFSAFLPGQGKEIARGGRYDDVGEVFGNARSATGFSADLFSLYRLSSHSGEVEPGVLAPEINDPELDAMVQSLRDQYVRVIVDLSNGNCSAQEQNCDRILVRDNQSWIVQQVI